MPRKDESFESIEGGLSPSPTRRRFVGGAAGVVASVTLAPGLARGQKQVEEAQGATLAAVARHVLPSELGDGLEAAVERFLLWSGGFRPVAELDHPYLWSDELQYGPPDPRPGWETQLKALDREAEERWQTTFVELDEGRQKRLLERQIERAHPASDEAQGMPFAAEATHVAVAMVAWWTSTSTANDLCYGARIGRHECRGLPSAVEIPQALDRDGDADGEGGEG